MILSQKKDLKDAIDSICKDFNCLSKLGFNDKYQRKFETFAWYMVEFTFL